MLGVFSRSTCTSGPNRYKKQFFSVYTDAKFVALDCGFLAYSSDSPSLRPLYGENEGVHCILRSGMVICYGEAAVIEITHGAYQLLNEANKADANKADVNKADDKERDRWMSVLSFDNNHIIYDSTNKGLVAARSLKQIPLYYGYDSEGSCIITDDENIIKTACKNSFTLIPEGKAALIPVSVASTQVEHQGGDGSSSKKASNRA